MLYSVLLFVTALSSVLTVCPVDWAEFNGECLYFSHDRRSWLDAENDCRKKFSYLATDDNEPKHSFIGKILSVMHSLKREYYWIGGSDFAVEGSWRWLETGLPLSNFSKWSPGFPGTNLTNNCIRMSYVGDDFRWQDYNCGDRSTYYICEKKAPSNPSGGNPVVIG